jgi:hypothetical protein
VIFAFVHGIKSIWAPAFYSALPPGQSPSIIFFLALNKEVYEREMDYLIEPAINPLI